MIGRIIPEEDVVVADPTEELALHLHNEHCVKGCERSPIYEGSQWLEWAERILAEREENEDES